MALVLAFWLVMTFLLVRHTYFPEGSQFAEVPPRVVMKLFLEQGSQNNTMHVYHYDKKIGHSSIDTKPIRMIDARGKEPTAHVLKMSGLLEKGMLKSVNEAVHWRLEARMKHMQEFEFLKGRILLNESGHALEFIWSAGDRAPKISITQNGTASAESQILQTLLGQLMGSGVALPGQSPASAGGIGADQVHVTTREGTMTISGQKRYGYTMEIGAMDRWRVKAFFTEAGELALVTLPEGYRLMEQVIYGLGPDYGEEEEE
ncbi:MAG TPA: hypothetical protein VLE43_14945 [Candidatus Saccharimonadia bacterium]|nr:hypothetical protein [Candidatus Saccharimonadia bacterium]